MKMGSRTALRTVESVCCHVNIRYQQLRLLVQTFLGLASSVGEGLRGESADFVVTLNFITGMRNSIRGESPPKSTTARIKFF